MGYKYDVTDIIASGGELIRQRGYHNTGIKDILEVSGIPKGSFYNFFDSKEDFGVAVIRQYGEDAADMIREQLDPAKGGTARDRLLSFYRQILNRNEEDELANGCLINNMSIEVSGQNQRIAEEVDRQFRSWVSTISKTVRLAQEEGEITSDFPAEHIAELLHSGVFGGFARMKATRSRKWLDTWLNMTFEMLTIEPVAVP